MENKENLIIIRTNEELDKLVALLKQNDFVAVDTETTGVEQDAEIIGFSVAWSIDTAYYVILAHWEPALCHMIYLETKNKAKELFEVLTTKNLIMHNAVFDCRIIHKNYNVSLMANVHTDTLLLGHLLDENRSNGLKELASSFFGDDSKKEQIEMKASIVANGGTVSAFKYELFKADSELIAKYGAKDAILTYKILAVLLPQLYEQGLETFFYDDETMPMLRLVTYDLNTVGLKVDLNKLQQLKSDLEVSLLESKAFIHGEIAKHISDKYPGTSKPKTFNIGSNKQLSWLLYEKLGNEFYTLTDEGRIVCKALGLRLPYAYKGKRDFIQACKNALGTVYKESEYDPKAKKITKAKKVGDYWNYIACGKESLKQLENRYKWVAELLKYGKNKKLLDTYVTGIQTRTKYGVIHPSFLQHGTTSGRYSSRNPNFQNLPRGDKRIKACIISRPDKVFVGADYSQLEPRVFASFSKDKRLLASFNGTDDFYSAIGMEVFEKYDCLPHKEGENAFGVKYPKLRDIAKVVALSATYGTTAPKMAPAIGKSIHEAQDVIDQYFAKFPSVLELMLESHEIAKTTGIVKNLFGRPRRMPMATEIPKLFGSSLHSELPYEYRNLLNLAINHRIQSTGASIINRAAIAFKRKLIENNILECHIVMQVHDELIVECHKKDAEIVTKLLKDAMENTVLLPGVSLEAIPKIANNIADLK